MSEPSDRSDSDSEAPPPHDGTSEADRPGYGPVREDEVSLLDILLVLARHKTLIVRTVLVFTLLGVTYALLAPEEFTSEARVVREAQQKGGGLPGGLPGGIGGGALSGLGISLGGGRPVVSHHRRFRTFCRAGRCDYRSCGTRSAFRTPSGQ